MTSVFIPYTIFDTTWKVLTLTKNLFENPKINKKTEWIYIREIIVWQKVKQSSERNNNKYIIRYKNR